MADVMDPKNADKRTWERYVKSGNLDEKAYEKHVKSLPDVAEKAASIETLMDDEDVVDDLDDEEDDEADDSDDAGGDDAKA